MQIVRDLPSLRAARAALPGPVAFVPTMGALHAGHMALVREARGRAAAVVASIFVNPLQFGAGEDLSRYPRQEAADAEMLEAAGVDLLWAPTPDVMYPEDFATTVRVDGLGDEFEGAHRPGHFDGVATVVAKLFGQVRPDLALFGEKDWQQLQVIRRMATDLDIAVEIIPVPTVRDADGVALSSRNAYLSSDERARARALPRVLLETAHRLATDADALADGRAALAAAGLEPDYLEVRGDRLLAAVRVGTTRLIDNVAVPQQQTRSHPR